MFGIEEVAPFLIPIVAILGAFSVAIVGILMKNREEERKHKERLVAMEKGIEIPEPPAEPRVKGSSYRGMRAWGFVLFFFGIALSAGIGLGADARDAVWGLLFVGIGIALLISAYLNRKDEEKSNRAQL
jgi:Domain of unknown function (DUF6249)